MKLHTTAADAVKAPVDHVMADFEDACPYEFKGEKSRKVMVEGAQHARLRLRRS